MTKLGTDKIKPGIIVVSKDGDTEGFKWMSDGWNTVKLAHTDRAKELMARAAACIEAAADVPDAIRRLREDGFDVRRDVDLERLMEQEEGREES